MDTPPRLHASAISSDIWRSRCVTSFKCITLEWHAWPGRMSKHNTMEEYSTFLRFLELEPSHLMQFQVMPNFFLCGVLLQWRRYSHFIYPDTSNAWKESSSSRLIYISSFFLSLYIYIYSSIEWLCLVWFYCI